MLKNYGFLGVMLLSMLLGCVLGWIAPGAAVAVKPLGTVFINMMFCVVVPLVFASVAGSVASMGNMRRAGRIMGITVTVFVATGTIAAIIMFALMKAVPPVLAPWQEIPAGEMGEYASLPDLLVNFFTVGDFAGLLSRKAMLPLIVFSVLFGFAANMAGGPETAVAKWLRSMTETMLQFIKLVTYYAPVAFFAIFANLVADYGPQIAGVYGRALAVYYPLCLIYVFTAFPLFARFGGGRRGPGVMLRHITKPAVVSLGTCSSVATIPTNMEEAGQTGISRDISEMVIPLGATMHMVGSCFSCVLKMAFPILVAIGNLMDPPATMINSSGDYVASFIVSRFVDGKNWLEKAMAKE